MAATSGGISTSNGTNTGTIPIVEANGAAIPALGFGTWQLTGEGCQEAVGWALAAGYRHLDTARMYDNEEQVGAGLKGSGVPRDDVFVTTKVWVDDLAPGDLERSAEASLVRLGFDAVDLLLVHWPSRDEPLAGTMRALSNAKRRGLTRHIGVSNFPSAMPDEAVRLADEPIAVNQCEYHPRLDQGVLLAACRRHGIAFTSYSPLGRGDILADPVVTGIADRLGRSPAQVVLRWHVQQPGVVAIPKAGSREHLQANLDVGSFTLSGADMAAISGLARSNGRIVDPASLAPRWD